MGTLVAAVLVAWSSSVSAQDRDDSIDVHVVADFGLGGAATDDGAGMRIATSRRLRIEAFTIGLTAGATGAPFDYGLLDAGVLIGAGFEMAPRWRLEALAEGGIRAVQIDSGGLLGDDPGYGYTSPTVGGRLGVDWRLASDEARFAGVLGLWVYGRVDLARAEDVTYTYTGCNWLFNDECGVRDGSGTVGGGYEIGAVITVGFDSRL